LTLAADSVILNLLEVRNPIKTKKHMKKFLINYIPAVHEGQVNGDNKAYFYRVEIDEQFANRSEGDKSAGLSAKDTESGLWKRFRFDGIQSAVAI
jgi:hypothetical protein